MYNITNGFACVNHKSLRFVLRDSSISKGDELLFGVVTRQRYTGGSR